MITTPKIINILRNTVDISGNSVKLLNKDVFRSNVIDDLVFESVFSTGVDKVIARFIIWEVARSLKIIPSSINNLYLARGSGKVPADFTTPAINVRGITYDMCRSIFEAAIKTNTKAVIFEIARSEMGYTDQTPQEFSTVVLASAIREGWIGPVFIQGDHYQAKSEIPGIPKVGDIDQIKNLIKDSINSGFYNIDIDMSTLVDLSKPVEKDQQVSNIKYSLELLEYVRSIEPQNIKVSVGCEIGHIGDKNSTLSDFEAFITGFSDVLQSGKGMSKIAVQTGTSHGGVVMPDGSIAKVDVDLSIHKNISRAAREKYAIGGTVQHGASTLPEDMFNQFPKNETLEIHLATGFQNMIMDHPSFPRELLQSIYKWLDQEMASEKEEGQTDEQFHYKSRKKAWGKYKKEIWSMGETNMKEIRKSLTQKFEFLFHELNVTGSGNLIDEFIKPQETQKIVTDFGINENDLGDVGKLSD